MTNHWNRAERPSLNKPSLYGIRIQGLLGPSWATRFEGLTLTGDPASGTTMLRGVVADQAKLHSLLQVIRDLNLQLLSVTYEGPAEAEAGDTT